MKTYIIIDMKRIAYCLLLLSVLFFGCASGSAKTSRETPETPPPTETAGSETPAAQEAGFNPLSISQEVINTTRTDVRIFIDELNKIILSKNYQAWKAHLSDAYFAEISSEAFLNEQMEKLKMLKIELKTPEDYFNKIIVPSRQRNRVDIDIVDIEFTSQNRVTVFTINHKDEQRNILYDLERSGSSWKIIN